VRWDLGRADVEGHRFHFTIVLPSSLPAHDWHTHGQVSHTLTVEVEGRPESGNILYKALGLGSTSVSQSRRGSSSSRQSPIRSPTPTRSLSPLGSRSSSPAGSPVSGALGPQALLLGDLSTTRQEAGLPKVPGYYESEEDKKLETGMEWLKGTHSRTRAIMIMHNPSTTNSFSDLDLRQRDYAPGLGIYELRISSDVVSLPLISADSCVTQLIVVVYDWWPYTYRNNVPGSFAKSDHLSLVPATCPNYGCALT
jgi:hypothetical protein